MVFSSIIFLFFFLPIVLLVYYMVGPRLWNPFLLLASLFFYAWGETVYVLLMLASILVNFAFGILIDNTRDNGKWKLPVLLTAITLNLLPLIFFKYGNFVVENVSAMLAGLGLGGLAQTQIHLPIGISFFTFQSISYLVDVYRNEAKSQRNPLNLGLYISLFPQLIAGPIVRYHDVASQINSRSVRFDDVYYGTRRFVIGLGKKVLIANTLGEAADAIFAVPAESLPAHLAWLGIAAYTLQIYFDFSGYSDMAIGLGRIFGFRFLENFNYPYISQNIREFWRRWHISLSSWFRDYLYIPLGGSKKSEWITYRNLLIVFVLCGFWHGASWTFLFWGLYHGVFLVLERTPVGSLIDALPRVCRHGYVLLVVMIGWVFFRADNIDYAFGYLQAMFSFGRETYMDVFVFSALSNEFYLALFLGVIASMPLRTMLPVFETLDPDTKVKSNNGVARLGLESAQLILLVGVFFLSIISLWGGGHNPFLYFRF